MQPTVLPQPHFAGGWKTASQLLNNIRSKNTSYRCRFVL